MPDRRDLDRGRLTARLGPAARVAPGRRRPAPAIFSDDRRRRRRRAAAPRVRLAPSPTGYFHVGSARAALFNWFFARQQGGTFVLRIEDTDEARNRPEWTDGIISAMSWLGMAPDEGPYFQSAAGRGAPGGHRGAVGRRRAVRVRVHARGDRRPGQGAGGGRRPDARLRRVLPRPGVGRGARAGRCASARPTRATVRVDDLVRGEVDFPLRALDDFVCVRGDGKPLFALANAVDDRTMAITPRDPGRGPACRRRRARCCCGRR